MGYTRYWERTEKPITNEFIDFVKGVVEDCKSRGIRIRNGLGEDEPIISTDGIFLNGDRNKNLDHETLAFTNDPEDIGFGFCKTARKPYDYAVRTILEEAVRQGIIEDLSSDGPEDRIVSDDEFIGDLKNANW